MPKLLKFVQQVVVQLPLENMVAFIGMTAIIFIHQRKGDFMSKYIIQ